MGRNNRLGDLRQQMRSLKTELNKTSKSLRNCRIFDVEAFFKVHLGAHYLAQLLQDTRFSSLRGVRFVACWSSVLNKAKRTKLLRI